jgi:hypothetical protein
MDVPEGIDLSWKVLMFLGFIVSGAFLGAWNLFNIRKNDHEKIAENLLGVKADLEKLIAKNHEAHEKKISTNREDLIGKIENNYSILDDRISRNKEDLISKIDGKCESIKKDIDRNDRDSTEQYKEIHGRLNRGSDELGTVKGELREVRGELKIVSEIVIDGVKK